MRWSPLTHATVATPPCWADAARLPSPLSLASSVSLGAVCLPPAQSGSVHRCCCCCRRGPHLVLLVSLPLLLPGSLHRCAALNASPLALLPPVFPHLHPPSIHPSIHPLLLCDSHLHRFSARTRLALESRHCAHQTYVQVLNMTDAFLLYSIMCRKAFVLCL